MHRFTLRQLEYLVACIEQGSVAAAANSLNVSQPTVSVAIHKLEAQFGVQLLIRHHSQGVSPTPGAHRILAEARALLAHATDLQSHASDAGEAVAGTLSLGSFVTLSPAMLPRLMQTLNHRHPDVTLTLSEGTQAVLVNGLLRGELDLALLYDLALPQSLRRVRLASLSPYVALPAAHPLSGCAEIDLAALAPEPMILLDVPPSRDYFTGLFTHNGLTPRIAYSSPSLELVRGMVGCGLGYAILTTRPANDVTYQGDTIVTRPLKQDVDKSHVVLASHDQVSATRVMTAVETVAIECFSTA